MSLKAYSVERIGNDPVFVFESVNPKTGLRIFKIVTFSQIKKGEELYFNLGFGDFDEKTGKPNDRIVSDNGDIRKVLATVVSTLEIFFKEQPKAIVHITGSDEVRNKYYQKLVRDYTKEIHDKYMIQGFRDNKIEIFQSKSEYEFLLVSLKKS
ncbi:MAG TPA: hypothetical protein DHV26_12540 [Cytophagales bacterium]|nr:hypothetical protein [Cytophagales bacterium]HRG08413.1 hypothetical protein [Cyclobacteriaceae bacterium]